MHDKRRGRDYRPWRGGTWGCGCTSVVVVLTALIVVVAIGGFLVFQAVRPRVSQASATAVAIRQVQQMDPNVRDFAVLSARYDAAPDRVYDDRGNLIYSESHSSCRVLL